MKKRIFRSGDVRIEIPKKAFGIIVRSFRTSHSIVSEDSERLFERLDRIDKAYLQTNFNEGELSRLKSTLPPSGV